MTSSIHTVRYQRFRELLIEARQTHGLSQAAIAQRLSTVQTFVSKYERGERRLDVVEFLDVAAALGADAIAIIREVQATNE
jgi:transcriptional regulator with XRE-family HTH domain